VNGREATGILHLASGLTVGTGDLWHLKSTTRFDFQQWLQSRLDPVQGCVKTPGGENPHGFPQGEEKVGMYGAVKVAYGGQMPRVA
jgi:hypothetical protein